MNKVLVGLGTLGMTAGLLVVPTTAEAATIRCSARMTVASPRQNTRTDVLVHTVGHATVTTTAHYKTTNTTHSARANSAGNADIAYRISRATKGFRVVVRVSVKSGASTGTCTTSFVPR